MIVVVVVVVFVVVDVVAVADVVVDAVVFDVVAVVDVDAVVVDDQPTLLPSPCRLFASLSHSRRLSHYLPPLHLLLLLPSDFLFLCFCHFRFACWRRLVSLLIGQLLFLW